MASPVSTHRLYADNWDTLVARRWESLSSEVAVAAFGWTMWHAWAVRAACRTARIAVGETIIAVTTRTWASDAKRCPAPAPLAPALATPPTPASPRHQHQDIKDHQGP